ncbi:MAG: PD-(D/E)XK nuclease family protein [Candidatus Sericytochromatia bacterium]|nr:PD-(D/E)XK nuclease family protein [Candidatus Sericytochromatia bacterium]
MLVTFDVDLEATAWPGARCGRATSGEVWTGPAGFLGILQTALGLGGLPDSDLERAAALSVRLTDPDKFWSASAAVDALGSAERLLAWRDELRLQGWKGTGATGRLADLWAVTTGLPMGRAERLEEVLEELHHANAGISQVRLVAPASHLPKLWQNVLAALQAQGTVIEVLPPPPAVVTGNDLEIARQGRGSLTGDGSLLLLRPSGPVEAAEEVAAWLASLDDLEGTVIISPDALLDSALGRHGLPTTGGTADARASVLPSILPLVIELGWGPQDPQVALDLLTLAKSPVPGKLRGDLARKLHDAPAVDSDLWRTTVSTILPTLDPKVQGRFNAIFRVDAQRGGRYPMQALLERVRLVEGWLRGSTHVDPPPAWPEAWAQASSQARELARALLAMGRTDVDATEIVRLLRRVEADVRAVYPAQAGLAFVDRPGAICGQARRVIWWQATLDQAPPLRGLPMTETERADLRGHGVHPVDGATMAEARALRHRRPLLRAEECLILVAPTADAKGDPAFPHPLWDEVSGLAPTPTVRDALQPAQLPVANRTIRSASAVVESIEQVTLAGSPPTRPEKLSVTAAGHLLQCSLRFVLEDLRKIRTGRSAVLPGADSALEFGKLAHAILQQVLQEGKVGPDAHQRAVELLRTDGPRLFAALFLPGADRVRTKLFRQIPEAAQHLTTMLHGRTVLGVEEKRDVVWNGITVEGRLDLRVDGPEAILDLKWGSGSRKRTSLQAGGALQLAAYAQMQGGTAPVGYYIISERNLLSTDGTIAAGAEVVRGPDPARTWGAFERGWDHRWSALDAGSVTVDGAKHDGIVPPLDSDSIDGDGRLLLKAECAYCDLDALCGRRFKRA